MLSRSDLRKKIFTVNETTFDTVAIEIFNYQYQNNLVYHEYCSRLHIDASAIDAVKKIPFLPVELFKTHRVVTGNLSTEKIFSSSGSTGQQTSRHYVADLSLYEESFLQCFLHFFGQAAQYCIVALLPAYLEREGSSLVYMVEKLMERSGHPQNGFFLYNHAALNNLISEIERARQPCLLIGVTFALLDFAAAHPLPLKFTRVIETGGMKGRREEITREAMHRQLQKAFEVDTIYSEYGMTELLSQAYMMQDGKFHVPAWMKVVVRDVHDPLQLIGNDNAGAINVVDLANLDSCSFIATADLGKVFYNGTFITLGRMDNSDVRGCNLLWET